jgi:hypothetical protein
MIEELVVYKKMKVMIGSTITYKTNAVSFFCYNSKVQDFIKICVWRMTLYLTGE